MIEISQCKRGQLGFALRSQRVGPVVFKFGKRLSRAFGEQSSQGLWIVVHFILSPFCCARWAAMRLTRFGFVFGINFVTRATGADRGEGCSTANESKYA